MTGQKKTLTFDDIPELDIPPFSEAVLMTLDQLGIKYEYDDTSPPNRDGEVTYRVYGVQHPAMEASDA